MTSDLDSYLPLSGGILTGDVTCNSTIAFSNNNNYGIRTITNNKVSIGADDKRFYRSYINYMYGASIFLSSNVSTTSTTYNGKLKCTTLTTDRVYTLPDKSGTIALISDISEAISSSGGTITGDLYVNGRLVNNGTGIEIYHATPYIDFHFNNSSDDYTSRIIETPSGVLNVSGALTASRFAAGWDSTYAGSISCSNWFRSSGNTGWYNASYGGGIYMEDSTWVKIYNGKNFYCSAQIKSSGGLLTENAESAGALAGLTIATSASYFRIRNDGGATYFMNGNSGGWTNYIIYYQDGKTTFPNDITCTGWVYPTGVEANYLQLNSESTTTYPANCYIDYNGYLYKTTTTSSKRFKDDISTTLPDELNPNKLYDVNVVQFKYKKDYFTNKDDIRYRKNLIGFIAEDIYEKYPIAADFHYDDNNEVVVDSWNPQYMIPAMLKLIQEQNKRIKTLEESLISK